MEEPLLPDERTSYKGDQSEKRDKLYPLTHPDIPYNNNITQLKNAVAANSASVPKKVPHPAV
eukprot:CAMPEP_0194525418 /NCGR_PEP_ID=MMETSP0253-20130528/60878_1 /TAXON_ID=2966 /ORGANISM="Noctiluca scintillans" /LENGTH=61 /DNA_ID=CAMNT_0039370143 /DNA_START=19 /DNA_END=200 /DNA_ORIENTATION=+